MANTCNINERGNQEIYIDGMPLEIPAGSYRTEIMPDGTVQVIVYQDQGNETQDLGSSTLLTEVPSVSDLDVRSKRMQTIGIQNTTVPTFNSYSFSENGVQTDLEIEEDIDPDIENKIILQQDEKKSSRSTASANIIHNLMTEDTLTTKSFLRGGKMVSFKKCGICGKIYKNKSNWMTHLKTHQKEDVYMCGFCGQIFQKALFPQHLKSHKKESEEGNLKHQAVGSNDDISFTTPGKVLDMTVPGHKELDSPRAPSFPKSPVKTITSTDGNEKETSYMVKSHQVTLPNQQVATVIDLGNLLNVAMNADTLGQEDNTVSNATILVSNGSPDQDDGEYDEKKTKYIYKCNVCGKEYNFKSNCHRHLKTHTQEKMYKCQFCSRTFMHRYELKMHQRVHTGEKPHKCPVCTRGFNEGGNLRRHMKIHAGDDTPYKCGICFKGFSDMYRLQVHLKVHSGEIVCDTCGKRFGKISDLYRHIRIHTGDKPYKCDICHKSFCQKVNLQTHYRTHSGKSPFKCTLCNFSFSRKITLDNHMAGHDEEEQAQHQYNLQLEEGGDMDPDFIHIKEEPKTPAPSLVQDEVEQEILVEVATIDAKTGLVEVSADQQEMETGLSQEELAQLVEATIVRNDTSVSGEMQQ